MWLASQRNALTEYVDDVDVKCECMYTDLIEMELLRFMAIRTLSTENLQKRASRTSAHIYCHLVYHIDLVFVSFFAFSLHSVSLFLSLLLKTSTIFPSPLASASFVFYHFRHSVSVHRLFEYVVSVAAQAWHTSSLFLFFSVLSSPSSRLLVFELLVVPWFMARFTNHKNINKKKQHTVLRCVGDCVCMCLFRNSVWIRNGNQ